MMANISQVEVGPSSFQKIKLLGRGDVGKVYLVREKKTDKLFAMKGWSDFDMCVPCRLTTILASPFKEGDDRTEENQARAC